MTLKLMNDAGRRALGGGVLALTLLVVSCGGGTQSSTFTARRVMAFGDETSLIVDTNGDGDGSKYSVNATVSDTDPTLACASNPIWIQAVATLYGLVFPQCNAGPTPVSSPTSRIRAAFGAQAADLAGQIDAQLAESGVADGDLATVLVGENDVLAQYAQYPMVGETELTANLEAAGTLVGQQVNRLADAGVKVLISTIPDVGVTPYALSERAGHIDTDRAALLTRLTASFNAKLRATITNDGRRIGLILLDELVSAVGRFNGLDGFTNSTVGVCDLNRSALTPPSILDCTNFTLITDGSGSAYLWADDRHLSSGGQLALGNLATSRARNNPF
ncbi:MAG: SGNH/GDSL hydrolase family protein [Caldimonas sp.]